MAKQIYNTRGMDLQYIKKMLAHKKERTRRNHEENIESFRDSLDRELYAKQVNEDEIAYLEKFIARKEKNVRKG